MKGKVDKEITATTTQIFNRYRQFLQILYIRNELSTALTFVKELQASLSVSRPTWEELDKNTPDTPERLLQCCYV